MKKFLAFLLAMIMVLSMSTVLVNAEEERVTLTIAQSYSDKVTDWETNVFTKYVEDNCNVNLDFVLYNDMKDKLNLQIAAGETLPDVICYKTSDLTLVNNWAQAGAIRDLTAYYEDPEFNSNLLAVEELVPGIYNYVRNFDGKFYGIPYYQRELHSNVHNKMWMNTKWLEELGLEVPTTLDEFHDVLVAFKEAHPDCYACLGSDTSKQGDLILWVMEAYIYDDNNDHLGFDENGKITTVYTTDEWKQALLYVRNLIDEGLYDPDCFTMDRSTTMTTILREQVVGCYLNGANNLYSETDPYWTYYEGIAPMKGPNGVQYAHYSEPSVGNAWFVTKDCPEELVDTAVRVGIWMFDPTEEVFIQGRYGELGVDREEPTVENSCYEGFPAMFKQVRDLWPLVQNTIWRNNFPMFSFNGDQGMEDTGDPDDWVHRIPNAVAKIYPYIPKEGEYVPTLIYTAEENEQINTIRTDLRSYVKESKILFVTRELSLEDDWDEYVQECYDIGMEEFLSVTQTAYDRMFGSN